MNACRARARPPTARWPPPCATPRRWAPCCLARCCSACANRPRPICRRFAAICRLGACRAGASKSRDDLVALERGLLLHLLVEAGLAGFLWGGLGLAVAHLVVPGHFRLPLGHGFAGAGEELDFLAEAEPRLVKERMGRRAGLLVRPGSGGRPMLDDNRRAVAAQFRRVGDAGGDGADRPSGGSCQSLSHRPGRRAARAAGHWRHHDQPPHRRPLRRPRRRSCRAWRCAAQQRARNHRRPRTAPTSPC